MPKNDPLASSGAASGPEAGADPPRGTSAAPSRTPDVGPPAAPPSAQAPPQRGEPDALPRTFCRRCQIEVQPQGKGRCPRCQTFLRLNFYPRKHPVNKLRRDALEAELAADYQPTTIMLRLRCRQLAAVMEQLENMRPGPPEWKRLMEAQDNLVALLDGARADCEQPAIAEVRSVIVEPPDSDGTRWTPPPTDEPPSSPAPPAPAAALRAAQRPHGATCAYCYQPSARCARLQIDDLKTWRVLHANEPTERARRTKEADDRATADMFGALHSDDQTDLLDQINRSNTSWNSSSETRTERPAARRRTPSISAPPVRRG